MAVNSLAHPSDYRFMNSIDFFMMAEVQVAKNCRMEVPLRRNNANEGRSSGRLAAFGARPFNMAVCELEGDAVMGVISERGAWLVHIWEVPSLTQGRPFECDVLNVIYNGDLDTDPSTGRSWIHPIPDLTGDQRMFNSAYNPRIFTLAPGDPNDDGSDPRAYTWQVNRIIHELQRNLPNAPVITTGYTIHPLSQEGPATARGKLLLQYTPSEFIQNGAQNAMVRIYVGDNPEEVWQFSWAAHEDMIIMPPLEEGYNSPN